MEYFKDVPNYEGYYQVSNHGRIIGIKKQKVLHPFKTNGGYKRIGLSKNNKKKNYLVHRLVIAAFRGESDLIVNHLDHNRINNNLTNLEYTTYLGNSQHSIKAGRHNHMFRSIPKLTLRKFNAEQIKYIRSGKETITNLARKFNTPHGVISRIVHRKTYKDIL